MLGLSALPWQRYRLQVELNERVAALSRKLDNAIDAHLQLELARAAGRSQELLTPFERGVEDTTAALARKGERLALARRDLDALAAETRDSQDAAI